MNNRKFKVNDKVRIIEDLDHNSGVLKKGFETVVVRPFWDGRVLIKVRDDNNYVNGYKGGIVHSDFLELVVEKPKPPHYPFNTFIFENDNMSKQKLRDYLKEKLIENYDVFCGFTTNTERKLNDEVVMERIIFIKEMQEDLENNFQKHVKLE